MLASLIRPFVIKLILLAKHIKYKLFKPISPWFASDHYIISRDKCSVFCGYYDLQPFKPSDSSQVLVHILDHSSSDNCVELSIYNSNSSSFFIFDKSEAWNFQQGSRLHWLTNETIIYNKLVNNIPVGIIYNVSSKAYQILPLAFNISDSSCNIYSLDYAHLDYCSEYGYSNANSSEYPLRVTMLLREYNYLIAKSKFIDVPTLDLHDCLVKKHHVNHLLPSPNCSFVIAIERYYIKGNRFDNLVVLDFDRQIFSRVIQSALISHYCFLSNDCILLWGKLRSNREGYYLIYFTQDGQIRHYKFLYPYQDGHPSAIDHNNVITEIPHGYLLVDNFNLIIEMSMVSSPPILYGLLPLVYPLDIDRRCDTHISVSYDKNFFEADFFSSLNRRSVAVFNRS